MKFIRDQYQLQKQNGYGADVLKKLYPFYFSDKDKYKILFISPCINRFELFTLIGPAYYMAAQSKRINCLVSGLEADKREFNDSTGELEILNSDVLYNDYIPSSNVVILPFSYQKWAISNEADKPSIYQRIRKANPKIKIVFTVDFNFYDVDKGHYNYRNINKNLKNIEENIRYADAIITGNEHLPKYIQDKMNLPGIRAIIIHPYFDHFHFADLDFEQKAPERGPKIKIGIPSDLFRRNDIEHFKDIYLWLQNTYKKEVDLVFYGYHPNKEIDLRDNRIGIIDNKELFPKPKGRQRPTYFTNYLREKRNDFMYHFKNVYNLNCDAWLFFYAPESKFWKYSPWDVDLLYAMYAELPIFTNYPLVGFPDMSKKENIKKQLAEFIEESIKTRRIPINRYKQFAINFGHQILPEIVWSQKNFTAIEEQFINLITY